MLNSDHPPPPPRSTCAVEGPQTIDPSSERCKDAIDATVLVEPAPTVATAAAAAAAGREGGGEGGAADAAASSVIATAASVYAFELSSGGNLEKQKAGSATHGKKTEMLVKLPTSAPGLITPEEVVGLVAEALPSADRTDIVAAHRLLSRMTAGGLKSALQKAVRFCALATKLIPIDEGDAAAKVPTTVFAAVAAALLFADKGTFSPELQLFTRGATAILKRLAVILVEDVWMPSDDAGIEIKIAALLSVALATQRMPNYFPPRAMMVSVVGLAAAATESCSIILWRKGGTAANAAAAAAAVGQRTNYKVKSPKHVQALEQAARLLRVIRSFQGDMAMMDTLAAIAKKSTGLLPMFTLGSSSGGGNARGGNNAGAIGRPKVMRAWHMIDQHFVRGIGHLLPDASGGPSFSTRFKLVFLKVTGVNPRLEDVSGFEKRPEVKTVRFAQKYLLRFASRCSRLQIEVVAGKSFSARLPLDPGALSAGIGPVRVNVNGSVNMKKASSPKPKAGGGGGGSGSSSFKKGGARDIFVILGVETPEDEVCMLPPSRNAKDLYNDVTPAEQEAAIAKARSLSLPVTSPLLPGKCTASFDAETCTWGLQTSTASAAGTPPRAWSEYCADGLVVKAVLHPTPDWAAGGLTPTILNNDDAIGWCLVETGNGVCANAESLVRSLAKALPSTVVLRARSFLRQQYATVQLPTPSLSGGMGSDQLMAYAGDWTAYRLLLILSRLVPGALVPEQAPRFKVKNAVLLRMLEAWLLPKAGVGGAGVGGAAAAAEAAAASGNAWADSKQWSEVLARCNAGLMEHQRDAVSRMMHRDALRGVPGHFVVMDTGLGKTVTAITYMLRRLASADAAGANVDAILWVTPKHTVPGLLKQLVDQWHCPTHEVKKSPKGSTQCTLKKHHVNVVQSDLLRSLILLDLPSRAPKLAVVFDEVDTMYEATQRTSACRRLAQLCPFFVAQTATPMVKNVEHLATWLANTEQYPVDKRNFLVAASGMVSTQISLGINAKEVLHTVPLSDAVREHHVAYTKSRNWALLAKQTTAATDAHLCDVAVRFASEDRAKWPDYGGALLVANDSEHVKRLLVMMKTKLPRAIGLVGEFEDMSDVRYSVIVVAKSKDRGYNAGSRLGAIVKGAYAGNGASRHQMRGRIRRIGQKRKEVIFCTVLMEHSMLELLHERQKSVDSVNISLEALAKRFDVEVLGLLV